MKRLRENPFRVPHAANLLDKEIAALWVDLGEEGGFEKIFRPASLMPMLILGGKGSGKTHLMRHFAFELQKMRAKKGLIEHLRDEQYIGIYLRAGGLHASRFKRAGGSEEGWIKLFAYYIELWLCERLLEIVLQIFPGEQSKALDSERLLGGIMGLFDSPPFKTPSSWSELLESVKTLRQGLDFAVNNSFSDEPPRVTVYATHGKLAFGIPLLLKTKLPQFFDGIVFTWLIDEYEHFHESAQRYVNTLIREKKAPSTFKVGVRLWGIYTYETYSNKEVLKQESEFEVLKLDERMRDSEAYDRFAANIVLRRLENAGWTGSENDVREAFVDTNEEWQQALRQRREKAGSPWLEKLQRNLEQFADSWLPNGSALDRSVKEIVECLEFPKEPYIEKLNTFLLYREWAKKSNLVDIAKDIKSEAQSFLEGKGSRHQTVDSKFKADMFAQMRREQQLPVAYSGFDSFVRMSSGVARSLLVTLKKIFDEALYNDECLFGGKPVSSAAQSRGVSGAADWFFEDVLIFGEDGIRVRVAIERLGRLFRALRFCEKPPECSLNSFSFDPNTLSGQTQRLLDLASRWSVFIPGKERLDRNAGAPFSLLRLSGMLCPKFDLPLGSRGNIALGGDEIEALFDAGEKSSAEEAEKRFSRIIFDRLIRCKPPFKRATSESHEAAQGLDQPELFGGV